MPLPEQKMGELFDVVWTSGRGMLPLIPGHSLVHCRSLAAHDIRSLSNPLRRLHRQTEEQFGRAPARLNCSS